MDWKCLELRGWQKGEQFLNRKKSAFIVLRLSMKLEEKFTGQGT